MLVDWFTVVAQLLNFLILVWLMKRFLYKPILHAIDEREKGIEAELANADEKRTEAFKERNELRRKNEDLDRRRAALLSLAAEAAQAERLRLLEDARKAAAELSLKRREALQNEERDIRQEISRRTRQEVFAIARKVLGDLAGASLEERLIEVFAHRLQAMDPQTTEDLATALHSAAGPALVRSAFELAAEQRAAIQTAIDETLSTDVPVRFETAPDLISGIELAINGQKVAWSIADYLTSLETVVEELIQDKDAPEATPGLQPDEPKGVTADQ